MLAVSDFKLCCVQLPELIYVFLPDPLVMQVPMAPLPSNPSDPSLSQDDENRYLGETDNEAIACSK